MDKISIVEQIKEELRVSSAALKVISQGVVISTADRLIISTNKAFADITQYPMEEIVGKNCKFLQGVDTKPETIELMRAAMSSGKEFVGEVLNYRKDGTPFWNDLTITPIHDEHSVAVTHFVGITRDITETKNLQDKLIAQLEETKRLNEIMVDRELKMIELKAQLTELEERLSTS